MKDEIIAKLEAIQKDLEEYLIEWKKRGGGTRGYAIGSAIKRINELKKFFKEHC